MDLVCVLKKRRAGFQLYLDPSYSINRFSNSEKYIIITDIIINGISRNSGPIALTDNKRAFYSIDLSNRVFAGAGLFFLPRNNNLKIFTVKRKVSKTF